MPLKVGVISCSPSPERPSLLYMKEQKKSIEEDKLRLCFESYMQGTGLDCSFLNALRNKMLF